MTLAILPLEIYIENYEKKSTDIIYVFYLSIAHDNRLEFFRKKVLLYPYVYIM